MKKAEIKSLPSSFYPLNAIIALKLLKHHDPVMPAKAKSIAHGNFIVLQCFLK
jgi:hypothetical protein